MGPVNGTALCALFGEGHQNSLFALVVFITDSHCKHNNLE